ncbi:MAG: TlpA family protein disulfide reductase [Sinobacteraceae bacterium]|nr:TlpA family protein disulfide reductase [Nevskiaceae bacterium]
MPSDPIHRQRPGLNRRQLLLNGMLACAGLQTLAVPAARARGLRVGAAAPVATLVTLDGRRIGTPDLLGQVVLLTFWATWCTPCRQELPALSAYAQRARPGSFQVLGFSLDGADQLGQVQDVARELTFPVGLLEQSDAAGYGRIWRLPVSFLIDQRGYLVDDGWHDRDPVWTAERLEHSVTPLLPAA